MGDLLRNTVLMCAATAWAVAQVIKTLIDWRLNRRLDLRRLYSNGGMPSAHTAFVVALATIIALTEGIGTTSFALAFALSAVVINDAVGVRYQTGKQSVVINDILRQVLVEGKPLSDETLHELVGHTPTEAFFGAVIGLVIPFFFR